MKICGYDNCNGIVHEKIPEWLSYERQLKIYVSWKTGVFTSDARHTWGYGCPFFNIIGS